MCFALAFIAREFTQIRDRQAERFWCLDNLHGLTIKAASEPGILMDATFDQNGDIDRQGFLVEIVEGKQVIKKVLPKLN